MSIEQWAWLTSGILLAVLMGIHLISGIVRGRRAYKGAAFIAIWHYDCDTSDRYEVFTSRNEAYAHIGRLCESACASKTYNMVAATVKEITF